MKFSAFLLSASLLPFASAHATPSVATVNCDGKSLVMTIDSLKISGGAARVQGYSVVSIASGVPLLVQKVKDRHLTAGDDEAFINNMRSARIEHAEGYSEEFWTDAQEEKLNALNLAATDEAEANGLNGGDPSERAKIAFETAQSSKRRAYYFSASQLKSAVAEEQEKLSCLNLKIEVIRTEAIDLNCSSFSFRSANFDDGVAAQVQRSFATLFAIPHKQDLTLGTYNTCDQFKEAR